MLNTAKVGLVARPFGGPKIWMVKQIGKLGTELEPDALTNRRIFEHREVEIHYALLAQSGIDSRLISEGPRIVRSAPIGIVPAGRCEAGGFEPCVAELDSRDRELPPTFLSQPGI